MKVLTEVVKVFDTDVISIGEGEEFRFRVEITKKIGSDQYEGKVYRLETYRLQPVFPQRDGELPDFESDSLIFVLDEMIDQSTLTGASIGEVVQLFEKSVAEIFDLN